MREISIGDIQGFRIGHGTDKEGGTGCTVIICRNGATAGADIRGGGPATRETELLRSVNMVEKVHAVMLSGGSAYGLDAGSGAMQYLEEKEIGFDVGVGVVPIVCGASLFDLVVGDPKSRPDKKMGYEACINSESNTVEQGNIGAGTGATVGKFLGPDRMMKSGIGVYAVQIGDLKCGAIVAVNAMGDVMDADTGERIAGILSEDKKTIGNTEKIMMEEIGKVRNVFSGNTTIGCIITNGRVTKTQANKLASMTHNGFARVINPVHTSVDGDSIFFLSNGEVEVMPDSLGTLAAKVMSAAVNNAVRNAESAYGLPGSEINRVY